MSDLSPIAKRVVQILAAHGPLRPANVGGLLFPVCRDMDGIRCAGARNAQGAALSAGKYLRQAKEAGLIARDFNTGGRWGITDKGRDAVAAWGKV